MLQRILGIGLALSLAANLTMAAMLEHSKREWAEERAQIAEDVATALRSHQEQSDLVTREAMRRAENAERNLRTFRGDLNTALTDPTYKAWAETELPAGVAERLEALR